MAASLGQRIMRKFTRFGLSLMPYFPLPQEWYRKILASDSEKRYASGRWDYLADVSEAHRYSLIIGCIEVYKDPQRAVLPSGACRPHGRHRHGCAGRTSRPLPVDPAGRFRR